MTHRRIAAVLLALLSLPAMALDTTDLLGVIAMPLAVAAASEVTGVPADDLSRLVTTLNRAEVPPTQVVQVIRYAPTALVVQVPQQPRFVDYVDTQVSQGVVGTQLVTRIDQQLRTYDITPEFVTLQEPATTFVVRNDYIPAQPVIGDANDLLSLIALPLAVSAASRISGVPVEELANLVAVLNSGGVAPQQMIEVVRYAPVALVADGEQPQFTTYLRSQVDDGVTGPRLVTVVEQRLRTYDIEPQIASSQITVIDNEETFIPQVVRTRVAEVRTHPHGGPPGQIKKQLGLQTGAEVVHGASKHEVVKHEAKHGAKHERTISVQVAPPPAVPPPPPMISNANGNGHGHGNEGKENKGHGNENGQGKGKGKGKG